jgi:sugar/nucleoside kinase (ribokinase family)
MDKKYDVFGMCNALFDIQAEVSDTQLTDLSLSKGAMMLLSDAEQAAIIPKVKNQIVHTEAGGSGANTMIGIAQLGGKTSFTSRVGRDDHGKMYRDSLTAMGVNPILGEGAGDTGVSLILITPDAQRTMLTYLGQSQSVTESDLDLEALRASKYLYVTGYLWDTDSQKAAVLTAMREANAAGVKVALSLSDPFCIGRHKADFKELLEKHVDVVFANKDEACGLMDETDPMVAARALAKLAGGLAVVTLDAGGSVLVSGDTVETIPVYPVKAVDTTGAGDMYAAGILYGLTQGLPLAETGRIASYCAAQVVAKLGPRLDGLDSQAVQVISKGF